MRHVLIRIAVAAVALAAFVGMAAVPAGAAGAQARHTVVVPLGQSIQQAVDEAHPGTTIVLEPGVYRQSVMIRKDEITLQGAGPGDGGTILMPPKKLPASLCRRVARWTGVCVLPTRIRNGHVVETADDDVVTGISFRGGWNNGVLAYGTTGLQILNDQAEGFHGYGFARFRSSGGLIAGNVAVGSLPESEAGIYVGDSPQAGALVQGNDSSGSTFGIFVRHSHDVEVAFNDVESDCQGILVFDDGEKGGVGEVDVHDNKASTNNESCPGGERGQRISGGGILLLGAQNSKVWRNLVQGNSGDKINSGGIVLLSAAPITGGADPVGNSIHDNSAYQNSPADIIYDGTGSGNVFKANHCGSSQPAGLCT